MALQPLKTDEEVSMQALSRINALLAIASLLLGSGAVLPARAADEQMTRERITILYDAFGKSSRLQKDWGFSALIEYGGKRILFDTGNNGDVLLHNAEAKGVDLADLDFVVVSHRHGDHMGGLTRLLQVNPKVKIFAPKEGFGVFGAQLPGTFLERQTKLPPHMRYFDGRPPDRLQFGSAWPGANFTWIGANTEVAPGFHVLALKGAWGTDLPLIELSLAIDTPEGTVLVVGCSHPTIERIVEAAIAATGARPHLLVGGFHLLPASPEETQRIASALHDVSKVEWVAPAHCTGEVAFEILQATFGDHYVYAGVGTTVRLTGDPVAKRAGHDDSDRREYRFLALRAGMLRFR
jgi:7,8-dihydropterin-6-yl-methyl-4-(beta-D-ribofuranosyl)aminobenzene 5'-phosphate synthase